MVEFLLRTIGFGTRSAHGDPRRQHTYRYEYERRLFDERMSFRTAKRFWRCPACRNSGQEFGDAGEAERKQLVALEDEIELQGGAVSDPVNREGLD